MRYEKVCVGGRMCLGGHISVECSWTRASGGEVHTTAEDTTCEAAERDRETEGQRRCRGAVGGLED